MISIRSLKDGFSSQFPDHPLTRVLLFEPDEMSAGVFIAKATTWLALTRTKEGR